MEEEVCEQEEVEECDEEGTVCDTVQVIIVMMIIMMLRIILMMMILMMMIDGGVLHQVRGGVRDRVQGEVLH